MCGIVGIIGLEDKIPDVLVDLFEQMLFHDTIRGPHSTGVFADNLKDKMTYYHKAPVGGPEFLSDYWGGMRKSIDEGGSRWIIGHNRWATIGNVNEENAHPFVEGNIIMVHNGTLSNHEEMKHEVEVDSHALCKEISDKGWEEAFNNAEGSWATVWTNFVDGSLHIMRNYQRPLGYAKITIAAKDYVVFASEMVMVQWLTARHRTLPTVKDIKEFEANKLYSWKKEGDGDLVASVETYTRKSKYVYETHYNSHWAPGTYYDTGWRNKNPKQGDRSKKDRSYLIGQFIGESLRFSVDSWEPYNPNSERGRMLCYVLPDQLPEGLTYDEVADYDAVIHGVSLEEYENLYKDTSLVWESTVSSDFVRGRESYIILHHDAKMIPFLLYDQENDCTLNIDDEEEEPVKESAKGSKKVLMICRMCESVGEYTEDRVCKDCQRYFDIAMGDY